MYEMNLIRYISVNSSVSGPFSRKRRINMWPYLRKAFPVRNFSSISKTTPPWNVLFYGTDSFSLVSLKALNIDRLSGNPPLVKHLDVVTKVSKSPLAVRQYADKNKLKVFDWPHCPVNGAYDVGVVVSFGHLIPANVIQAFPRGMVNVHGSLLPRWRGAAPIANAILNGDTETGVTIMQISPYKFDVGKIILQQSYALPDDATTTTSSITPMLAEIGATLLLECLKDLCPLLDRSKSQDSSLATKAPKLKPSQAIIKWDQYTCQYIDRLYRAMHDSIRLETLWHGVRVTLSDMVHPNEMIQVDVNRVTEWGESLPFDMKPGKVLFHKKRKILCILCKDGWTGFKVIWVQGHRIMSALDFYNGFMTKITLDQLYFE